MFDNIPESYEDFDSIRNLKEAKEYVESNFVDKDGRFRKINAIKFVRNVARKYCGDYTGNIEEKEEIIKEKDDEIKFLKSVIIGLLK